MMPLSCIWISATSSSPTTRRASCTRAGLRAASGGTPSARARSLPPLRPAGRGAGGNGEEGGAGGGVT